MQTLMRHNTCQQLPLDQYERKDMNYNKFYNRIETLLDSNQYLKQFFLLIHLVVDLCDKLEDFSLLIDPFHGLSLFTFVFEKQEIGQNHTNAAMFSFFFNGLIHNVPKPNCITDLFGNIRSFGSRHC